MTGARAGAPAGCLACWMAASRAAPTVPAAAPAPVACAQALAAATAKLLKPDGLFRERLALWDKRVVRPAGAAASHAAACRKAASWQLSCCSLWPAARRSCGLAPPRTAPSN